MIANNVDCTIFDVGKITRARDEMNKWGWRNKKSSSKVGSSLIEKVDKGECDCFIGKYLRDVKSRYVHLRSQKGKQEGRKEGGYPNFLLHLADGCLNPEIASASFKITHCVSLLLSPGFHIWRSVGPIQPRKISPEGHQAIQNTVVPCVDSGQTT